MNLNWLSASEFRALLISEGVGDSELIRVVAYGARDLGLVASGFRRIHFDQEIAEATERELIKGNIWRVFWKVDPAYEWTDSETKSMFQRIVRWESGGFTWTLKKPDGSFRQETWRSVFFDRNSAHRVADIFRSRRDTGFIQDYEIEDWIRNKCVTDNSKEAWRDYKRQFGDRAGKRDQHFMPIWQNVKGNRKRGQRVSKLL